VNFPNRAANHFDARDGLMRPENILARIVGINVRRDKIHWHAILNGVLNETIDPGGLRRSGSTHAQPAIHALQGSRGCIIKLVISLFLRIAHPKINIRLVPDFEVPVGNLINAVALDKVLRKMSDQVVPFVYIFRRRNDRLYQNACSLGCAASFLGMKLISTNGRT